MQLWITHSINRFKSAVFETLVAEEYEAAVVGTGFAKGEAWNRTDVWSYDHQSAAEDRPLFALMLVNLPKRALKFHIAKVEPKACLQAYSNQFISGRRNLLMVAAKTSSTDASIFVSQHFSHSDLGTVFDLVPDWKNKISTTKLVETNFESAIDYCLSERVHEKCQLQFSVIIMVVIISCSLVKAICMLSTLLRQKIPTLVTLETLCPHFLMTPILQHLGDVPCQKEMS